MITEYPLEHRLYDQSEYEPFWAAAAALDLPLSLHTATRRQGRIRGAGDKMLRVASPAEMFWADIPSPVSHLEGDREFADSLSDRRAYSVGTRLNHGWAVSSSAASANSVASSP